MTDTLRDALSAWTNEAFARLQRTQLGPRVAPPGRVTRIHDGIVFVEGLVDVRVGERIELARGGGLAPIPAMASALEHNAAGCVLLGRDAGLRAGASARATGASLSVPVGDEWLGRMIDPLGRPLDGLPAPPHTRMAPIECAPPPILDRDFIDRALHTGTTAIDALIPLGRGQRELIVGDRQTGKSSLALDAMLAQAPGDVVCVHVSIGQRPAATLRAIETAREKGRLRDCLFIVATPDDPPGLQWMAPFAACSWAEHFRDKGRDVLLVVDDLSKHAAVHRQIGLLLGHPPGREAYPGDVFYLHARLLERAAKLSPVRGGGSLSILAIAESQGGNIAAYIPTNLISIVDGQIVCDTKLWALGQRPGIDIGRSVSRVGGRSQAPALRALAGRLKLEYAQFLELEEFSRFGGLADARAQARLAHGARVRAALAQDVHTPLAAVTQYALLFAVGEGLLDTRPLGDVAALRRAVADGAANFADLAATIAAGEVPTQAAHERLRTQLAALLEAKGSADGA
jgi:F-type H+/Na+-transporting ATPase subunit alpha